MLVRTIQNYKSKDCSANKIVLKSTTTRKPRLFNECDIVLIASKYCTTSELPVYANAHYYSVS